MIKIMAFDLVGVLVHENDIVLSQTEEKLEKLFGPNLNDESYLIEARKFIDNDSNIMTITENLINRLYKVKNKELFKKIKENNNSVKIIIATNHLSCIEKYIKKTFDLNYLDDIIISATIHKIKPHADFYKYILNKYKINANELLFLDDNNKNIEEARKLGINTIKVEKNTNLLDNIKNYF